MKKLLCLILIFNLYSCTFNNKKEDKFNLIKKEIKNKEIKKDSLFLLNKKNAIPFLYKYGKNNPEKNVKIKTDFGEIEIELFDSTPYHRANFIYLTKQKYFDKTFFHRVVKDFIIQGGNSDNFNTSKKRSSIGRYLLPPDTDKKIKHHRGIISMPSSEIKNPHKLASPFEFFIVVKKNGAYHLDGKYTAFGRVIKGLNVVDKISNQPTDNREAPIKNILIKKIEILK